MTAARRRSSARKRCALANNPLEGEQLLLDAMFGDPRATPSASEQQQTPSPQAPKRPQPVAKPTPAKPTHYKIVSISMYVEDIQRLESMVRELKRRGHHKANKSQLIRCALAQLDLDAVPKEF